MKKALQLISICFLVLIFVLTLCFAFIPIATRATTSFETTEAFKLLDEFLTENPSRVAGTQGEHKAKDWLKGKLNLFGFSASSLTEQIIPEVNESYNLIATIDVAGTDNLVVVGAHYDSVSGSLGATDNASGVVAALLVARSLLQQKASLSFDVQVVFFGSEENGLLGSFAFAETLNTSKTLLMVNMDSIAVGDNLYIYGEEVMTDFQRIFVDGANGAPTQLKNKPLGIGINTAIDYWGYGYYQLAQMSDHTPFRLREIPTVFFFSGNYPSIFGDYVESTDERFRVMNTSSDTLERLKERGSQAVSKIETVVQSVSTALTTVSNKDIILNARSELVSRLWFQTLYIYIMVFVLLGVLALVASICFKKLQKKALLGTAEIKKSSLFNSPNADKVFDLDEQPKKENNKKQSSDVDDIFKF